MTTVGERSDEHRKGFARMALAVAAVVLLAGAVCAVPSTNGITCESYPDADAVAVEEEGGRGSAEADVGELFHGAVF